MFQTNLKIGDAIWPIEMTLTNRDSMGFRMLLGREAMSGRVLVDPAQQPFGSNQ
jgi:ribosomal protein S6--L-glutamate ligase